MADQPREVDLRDFVSFRRFMADCADEVFPSLARAESFVRDHKKELIESGQYLPRRNGGLVGPEFGTVPADMMRREALEGLQKRKAS